MVNFARFGSTFRRALSPTPELAGAAPHAPALLSLAFPDKSFAPEFLISDNISSQPPISSSEDLINRFFLTFL